MEPGAPERRDDVVVLVRDTVGECRAPLRRADPGRVVEVLDRDRHAQERRRLLGAHTRLRLAGLLEGPLDREREVGIQLRVQLVDPRGVQLHQLDGRHLLGPDQLGLLQRGRERQFRIAHGPRSLLE